MEQTTDHDPQDGSSEEHPSLADEARAALAAAEARDGGRPTLAKTIVGIESPAINEGPPVSSGMVRGLWYPGTWQDPDLPDRPPEPHFAVASRRTTRKDRALLIAGLAGFILFGLLVTIMVDLLNAHQVPAGS